MSFTTPIFLFLFLPFSLLLYQFVPAKLKNIFILAISLFFYGWTELGFLPIIILVILFNWSLAGLMSKYQGQKKIFLAIGILANVGLLIYAKYTPFILTNLNVLTTWLGTKSPNISPISLPLGISFFTFHSLSYLIDIFQNKAKSTSIVNSGVYMLFFPQVVAGPINRYEKMENQLSSHAVRSEELSGGIERFIKGFAEKMLLARTFAMLADQIFKMSSSDMGFVFAWLGLIAYTLQIYFDFAGYSNMAIGIAQLFGFHLTENFNFPYSATSIKDFWGRWHISLTTWLREYIYFPLGGSRKGNFKTYLNILIVFLVSGIWHGAGWQFIVWGLWHGLFMILEKWGSQSKFVIKAIYAPISHLYTLLVVMIGWVIFRAPDLPSAVIYLKSLFTLTLSRSDLILTLSYLSPYTIASIIVGVLLAGGFTLQLPKKFGWLKIVWFVLLFLVSLLRVANSFYGSFIYAQF